MLYETIGGLALIFGVYTQWVALFLGVHLLFAAYLGHAGNGWTFSSQGGGYEFPLFWAISCFALTLLGDGAHSLKSGARSKDRWLEAGPMRSIWSRLLCRLTLR